MSKTNRLVLMVAVSSLASQISLNMFGTGFILAMSPFMMAVFLYFFRDLDPLKACLWMTLFSPLVRLLVTIANTGDIGKSVHLVTPDTGFFFGYAIFFSIVFKNLGYTPYHKFYFRIVLCDFLGNCCEQTFRVAVGLAEYTWSSFLAFVAIALIRSFLVVLVCMASDAYRSLLERTEHEENYKRLVLMASTFNSEVYFMQKNMNEIEDIMKNAYDLYRDLRSGDYPNELQATSLSIAKDIHEVKKGYKRVIKGLQDNFLSDFADSRIKLSDLIKILSVDIERTREMLGINLGFSGSCETDHLIQKHFAFMSIVRNLISNSIDAIMSMPGNPRGEIYMRCRDMTKDGKDYCAVEVKDNGPGIPENLMDILFVPGFSTKYNESTGDINRGLGLTLAKDLMEEKFEGSIEVSSDKRGTTFTLWFPVDMLTEQVPSNTEGTIFSLDNATEGIGPYTESREKSHEDGSSNSTMTNEEKISEHIS